MADDPKVGFLQWARSIAKDISDLGKKIDDLRDKVQKHGIILFFGVVTGAVVFVYNSYDLLWDTILPSLGLRESIHYHFSPREAVFFSKGFNYLTNNTRFNFHVNIANAGQPIGGSGRILIVRQDNSGLPSLVAVSNLQRSVDNMSLSIDFEPTSSMVRLVDLPTELLFCILQTSGKRRIISVLTRLATEFANDMEVKSVWPQGKVGYVPYTEIPVNPDADDPLTMDAICSQMSEVVEKGAVPACAPFSKILSRNCDPSVTQIIIR